MIHAHVEVVKNTRSVVEEIYNFMDIYIINEEIKSLNSDLEEVGDSL